MTREEAKDFMWIENDKNPTVIRWQHHSTIRNLVSNLIDKIFDEHEAEIKSLRDEIERQKRINNELLYTPFKKMMREEIKAERKKSRSIVAMLFWDMKKYDRYSKVNNVQDYVNNKNKFYALESVFKKAYAILKDKQ